MSQTLKQVKNSTVKIIDKDGNFGGTGFFVEDKKYCITCHHNIYNMDKILIRDKNDKCYPVEWIEELSDMKNDIAFLKLNKSKFEPLEYFPVTIPSAEVLVIGFPKDEVDRLPEGRPEPGRLSDETFTIRWESEAIEGSQKWNKKPKKNINIYIFNGNFDVGYSGAPVCYKANYSVIGMFHAKDDGHGYVIPIETIMNNDIQKKAINNQSNEINNQGNEIKLILKDIENIVPKYDYGYYRLYELSMISSQLYSQKRINETEFRLLQDKLQQADLKYWNTLTMPNTNNQASQLVQMIIEDIKNTHKWSIDWYERFYNLSLIINKFYAQNRINQEQFMDLQKTLRHYEPP